MKRYCIDCAEREAMVNFRRCYECHNLNRYDNDVIVTIVYDPDKERHVVRKQKLSRRPR